MIKRIILLLILSLAGVSHADEEYILGTGDIVRIDVYGQKDLNTVTRINEVNKITFPLIGETTIGGISPSKAEVLIGNALKKGGFIRSPQVSLVVEQYRSRQVSILGQVLKPGKYSIDGPARLVDILALAGGVTGTGAEIIRLIRKDKDGRETQKSIDLFKILNEGELAQNIKIENEDIIFVPPMDRFYIYGHVHRPGVYRLERGMTVMQALAVGGGLTVKGTERGIKIRRRNGDGKMMEVGSGITSILRSDDVIYVSESIF